MLYEVSIERNGVQVFVGTLTGSSSEDTVFAYRQEYLRSNDAAPISISLPLQPEPFTP